MRIEIVTADKSRVVVDEFKPRRTNRDRRTDRHRDKADWQAHAREYLS